MTEYSVDIEEKSSLSKTKRKKQMKELQDLGVELVHLSKSDLAKFDLPDILLDAIQLAQSVNSNSALRRQYQYIGKLMRNVDFESVLSQLSAIKGESKIAVLALHQSEKWRDEMLKSDDAVNEFIRLFPQCKSKELRMLVKSVRKEIENDKVRNFRRLFRFIHNLLEGHNK